MSDVRRFKYDTPANKAIDTAENLLKDLSENNVVDVRSDNRRQFDAVFHILKGIFLELERIGDQLEYSAQGFLDRDRG